MNYFSIKSVDISHLNVFGCKAFFYNNPKNELNLTITLNLGIFLGYAPDSLGYKILDISTNSIVNFKRCLFYGRYAWNYKYYILL